MKKLALILFAILSINTYAGESIFNKANELYSQERYNDAILLYDSIISIGLESSELYYNLGNCYYKNADWANAIWHYEKSLKLESLTNTLHNLELVQLKIVDRIEPLPQLFYKKWWYSFISLFTTYFWQIITLLIIWTALFLKLLSQFTTIKKEHSLQFLYLTAIILLFATYSAYKENYTKKEVIIFSSTVVVNSAPTNNSTNLFSLHSGSKAEIIDQIGNWINIKIANGNSGWVEQTDCKEL
jgi:tetratricopeptide (TPR) repeat protein